MGDGAKGTTDSQDKQTDGLDCTRTCIRKERKKERGEKRFLSRSVSGIT